MCVYLGGELRRKRLAEGIPYHPEVGILQTRLVFVSVAWLCYVHIETLVFTVPVCLPYHEQVLNWFEEAASAIDHPGFRAAVASAWTPCNASLEQKKAEACGRFDVSAMDVSERRARLQQRAKEEGWMCHGASSLSSPVLLQKRWNLLDAWRTGRLLCRGSTLTSIRRSWPSGTQ